MHFILIPLICAMLQPSFKEAQLKKPRVKMAYDEKERIVRDYFRKKDLDYNGFELFIRAFKKEGELEVWVRDKKGDLYTLLQTYPFCSSSGTLGPKRKEGDRQIPEGIYRINHFNPESNFHLSLGVSYPNESDKIFGDKKHPGGAIYIHGNCVTIGCIPITDDKIKELYILAVEARNAGQKNIPVHVFPARLDENGLKDLVREFSQHAKFWQNLQPVYLDFEKNRKMRRIAITQFGEYLVGN